MMYLSNLLINVGSNPDRPRPGRMWLRNMYHVHQRLCMAFPSNGRISDDPEFIKPFNPEDFGKQVHTARDTNTGFLFRIDPLSGGAVMIIVQSALKPDWDYAFHNAGFLLPADPEVKSFDPCFELEQPLRFRLVANPTRKIDTKSGSDGIRRHGKRVPVPTEELKSWLSKRAESTGFTYDEDSAIIQSGYIYVKKSQDKNGQRLRSVRYDGVLTVTDPDAFLETLIRGIGPGKAFGFGLLSVAPVSVDRT